MANDANSDAPLAEPVREVGQSAGIPTTARRLPAWWGMAVVLALTFAVYLPTLRYQFVHDDRGQIVENPAIHSWRTVPTYFTAHVWAGVMAEEWVNYYRPLFLLWVRINEAVFGNRAWGWHLTTVLAHVLATLLVYLLAWRLGIGRDVALLAALIFGLHPAHIEAVAWISGVNEPLLGIFLIASLLAYLPSATAGTHAVQRKVLSLVLFAFALLMKENALALPALLLVYEWVFRGEWRRPLEVRRILAWCGNALGKIWPYLLIVAIYVPARIYALKGFSHVVTPLSTAQLLFTWPSLIGFWLHHLIWPAGLSSYYNFPAVLHPTLRNFILPAIFDVGVGLGVFACVRTSRPAAFFAVWLVLPLIPLLNLRVFSANDFAHDRHLYLPSVGLAVLLAMLLKKACWGPPRWLGAPVSLWCVVLCLAALMSYGTVTQSFYFKDNLTFYAYNLTRAPHNPDAESNYASLLGERGQYGPAVEAFLDAVNYNPTYWTPAYNLALTYYKVGKLPEAEQYFLRAISIKPNNSDEYFYLAMTRFKSGRTPEAIATMRQAIAIRPDGYAYHFALGVMLKTQGDLAGALREFKAELANNPGEQGAAAQINAIENQATSDK
ncbi:MAG TPA: tetratricopeptide repeat protein [Terriglobia bacterium]|nr:tetratricopeptide repeat protein [Terriglobia bacterium]